MSEKESVGAAEMKDDGTIHMFLRAEGDDGEIGTAMFIYPPSHKDYAAMIEHVGGLEPGESKQVPPWPDPE